MRIEPLEDRRLLAMVTVNTLGDSVNFNDGVTSLREAIFATNLVGGADTIDFAPSLTSGGPATILLTQGELAITDALAIIGPGANLLTIDAGGNDPTPNVNNGDGSRIFNIDDSNNASLLDVSISGLTLTGGDVTGNGGAIFARENLTITNSAVSGNAVRQSSPFVAGSGGGIYGHYGNLTVTDSTISGNSAGGGSTGSGYRNIAGGGIYSGNVTVTNSTISGNSARYGGGLFTSSHYGNVTLTHTTLSGNTALNSGGAIMSSQDILSVTDSTISGNSAGNGAGPGDGGGILSFSSNVTVTGSTISGNSASGGAGGGISKIYGSLTVAVSTISGNSSRFGGGILSFGYTSVSGSTISNNSAFTEGGGIWTTGITVLSHTIVASNTGTASISNDVFGRVAVAFSLLGVDTGATITDNGGNLIGTADAPIDPLLDPLADNGGRTPTHALLAGSPAINAGDLTAVAGVNGVSEFDQRGTPFGRVFHGRIDIGAFEYQAASDLNLVVDTLADESDGNYALGDLSLREALLLANTYPSIDTIRFAPALADGTILLTMGELTITDNTSIEGLGANLLTIDASGNDPTPDENNGDGSRVFNVDDGNPGVLRSVTIRGLTLTGGDSQQPGGAIAARENLTVVDSTITGNATRSGGISGGGGIYSSASATLPNSLTVRNSLIVGNSSAYIEGGGIRKRFGSLVIDGSTISGNSALEAGGGVSASESVTVAITNTTISNNHVNGAGTLYDGGGGLFLFRATTTISGSTISGNSSGVKGGGIYNYSGNLSVVDSTISGNSAANGDGGGIFSRTGNLTVSGSIISGNSANSTVFYGYALGGGIYHHGNSNTQLTVTSSTIEGNSATHGGGIHTSGVINNFTNASVTDSTVAGNLAEVGGGILNSQGILTVIDSTISGNSATKAFDGNGGGIAQTGGNLTVTRSVISDNLARNRGGGIFNGSNFFGGGGSVTVTGSTISGNSAFQPDYSLGGGIYSYGGSLTVIGSTISDNSATGSGGGIVSQRGNLTVTSTTIRGNSAKYGGGISRFSYATATITGCTISGNMALDGFGGGIFNVGSGPLSVTASTISGNSAKNGGGIVSGYRYNASVVTITDSTISGNKAVDGSGGGIYHRVTSGSLTVINTTISGNNATEHGGGLYLRVYGSGAGPFTIRHSTIASNFAEGTFAGGGIFVNSGTLVLDHTIVATNGAPINSGRDLTGLLGVVIDARYSLIGTNGASGLAAAPVGSPDAKGNLIGGVDFSEWIDPLLAPLAHNGGLTPNRALSSDSPALDAGDPSALGGVGTVPGFDQRGVPFVRVYDGDGVGGGRIDIGAYERQSVTTPSLIVDTLADETDGDYSPGDFSLREAIGLANGNVDSSETITFAAALTAGGAATIHLTRGELGIGDSLSIVGPGANLLTIDASANDPTPDQNNGDGSRVFHADDGDRATDKSVSLFGLTLTGGDGIFYGGGIFSAENLTIADSTIRGNGYGGIVSFGKLVTITGSTISDNKGVGISVYNANLTVTDSTVSGNVGAQVGGGINGGGGTTTVVRSTVSGNSAFQGGGIYLSQGILSVTASTISGNSANFGGGIMTRYGSPATITDSLISGNSAVDGYGGGILSLSGGMLIVSNSTISGNSATRYGGGIHTRTYLTVSHSTITGNRTGNNGGGIYSGPYINAQLDHTIVAGNTRGSTTRSDVFGTATLRFSLLGVNTGATVIDLGGNQIGTNPMLGPLANNGGPTLPDGSKMLTHALLPGSPAINAGDPSAVAGIGGVPQFDQRGRPWSRVSGGRIDIGALESQVLPPSAFGDYNDDGVVSAPDYTVWEDTFGSTTDLRADGNGNGTIDAADYTLWKSNFGQTLTGVAIIPASVTVAAGATTQLTAAVVDQFGNPMSAQPAFTWSVASGAGSINGSGLYTAALSAGSATVHAASASGSADANITIVAPLAWYKSDASTGTALTDSSGNGKTGTLTGSAGWAAGVSSNALSLTGGSASLPAGIVNGLNDFTIATWLRINALGTWSRVFDFGTGTTVNMFLTPRANGAGGPLRFAITTSGGGGEQQLNGPTLSAGMWYHLAITLAGNTGTMYVNGAEVATNANMTIHPAALGNTTQNYLGDSQYAVDPNLLGRIDDFRIYATALTAQQVLQLASPIVVTPAATAANPVTAMSTSLSVLAADVTAGEPALTYTWSTTGSPPAPVMFSANGTNAAKNTTVTFTQVGIYNFQVTVVNPVAGLSTNSSTSVTVMLPGDHNFNDIVDTADYTVWEDTFGSTTDPRADGNGDGVVNTLDYTLWKTNFGQMLPLPGAGSGAFAFAALTQQQDPAAHVTTAMAEPMTSVRTAKENEPRANDRSIVISRLDVRSPKATTTWGVGSRRTRADTSFFAARQDNALAAWLATHAKDDRTGDADQLLDVDTNRAGTDSEMMGLTTVDLAFERLEELSI